jgi:hypothetical protein
MLGARGGLVKRARPSRERDAALRRLVGLERHMWLRAGDRRLDPRFDERQMSLERLSSVQFVRFDVGGLSADEFIALAREGRLSIDVAHPSLAASASITAELAAALAEDLASSSS